MSIPQMEEREKGAVSLLEKIIAENFSAMGKVLDKQFHKAKRTSNCLNVKRPFSKTFYIRAVKKSMLKKKSQW